MTYVYGATLNTNAAMRKRIQMLEGELERKDVIIRDLDRRVRGLASANAKLRGAPKPVRHGTASEYSRHYGRGEQPCDECREAYNARRRELNKKNRDQK